MASAVVLLVAVVMVAIFADQLLGNNASVVSGAEPDTEAGRLLVGVVQVLAVGSAAGLAAFLLWRRRYRLLLTLLLGALIAGLGMIGLMHLLAPDQPPDLVTNRHHGSWLAGSAFPSAAYFAGGCAILVTLTPWLSRAWRRTLWILLATAAVARLVAGTALPAELVVAAAIGATVGFGLLVAFGSPDRRIGPSGVADALTASGLSIAGVRAADVEAKGCRPFVATTADGRRLFVKLFGKDQRQADLLYRAYRYGRLKGVGHSRPAASLIQSVEHQALAEIMAERAGVRVPRVERIAQAPDGSAMLAMDFVHGRSLNQVPAEGISEELLSELWRQVDRLHRAGIAHRSLRSGNVMLDTANQTRIVDFSFSELAATERQRSLDVAELLASTAALVGPERAVAGAVSGVGGEEVTRAVPLLQPLALSASTRQAVRGKDGLLTRTRVAAAGVMGAPANELARLQRVRLRTVLMIGLAVGAFYFLLPQLAQARNSWKAFQSANFEWLPLVIAMSALTYVAGNLSIMGTVSRRLPFGPTLLLQSASSFVNRVSPANVGGMALNVRYLQKSGVDSPTAVSAVGLNGFVGGIMHIVLIAVFFAWSGAALTKAFKLPSGSKLLLVLAVLAAALGVVLATRWGRRTVWSRLVRGIQRSLANLRQVAASPVKLALLFGGSALVTLAYVGALAASIQAFGGGVSIARVGAVYLAAAAIAAAAPTPGGLGAIEAALVAGLTGVGMRPAAAVSAVLTYRLATYWLPVLPGWVSWHFLQKRQYI